MYINAAVICIVVCLCRIHVLSYQCSFKSVYLLHSRATLALQAAFEQNLPMKSLENLTRKEKNKEKSLDNIKLPFKRVRNEPPKNVNIDPKNVTVGQFAKVLKYFPEGSNVWTFGNKITGEKEMIEVPTVISVGMPVEFFANGKVKFGNYMGKKNGSAALTIKLPSGDLTYIDTEQIISCWDDLSDPEIPSTIEAWSTVASQAITHLAQLSPRKNDLDEFWNLARSRPKNFSVDSFDLGVYIFQEYAFMDWFNPTSASSNVSALSASQRYAAAILLSNDIFHFNRKRTFKHSTNEASDNSTVVIEGGYKPNTNAVLEFIERDKFIEYYRLSISNNSTQKMLENSFIANVVNKYIRALEVYSREFEDVPPPPALADLFKFIRLSMKPRSARKILKSLVLKSEYPDNDQLDMAYPVNNAYTSHWSDLALQETDQLVQFVKNKRSELILSNTTVTSGKRGAFGKMDYRASAYDNPVICIDSKDTKFFDDGFSISPSTNEIIIHITDVVENLERYKGLQDTAKERVCSIYLPAGTIHMLPERALNSLKLDTANPSETISVAVKLDFQTGEILGYRVFPAIIGPISTIDEQTAELIINEAQVSSIEDLSSKYSYSKAFVRDLVLMKDIVNKTVEFNRWLAPDDRQLPNTISQISKRYNKYTGQMDVKSYEITHAKFIVDTLLALYSNATIAHCEKNNVRVPVAYVNRNQQITSLVRRYATKPLRSWLSQIQQKQIRAALKMDIGLDKRECALAIAHFKLKKQKGPLSWFNIDRRQF